MAITRIVHRIDIQWTDTDDGQGSTFKDPVLTIVGEIQDDVEGTSAGKHFATLRSDMGSGGQAKFDAFLADVLAFADAQTGGRGISFPS